MDFVAQLWLPILVATALCFAASAVIWVLGPHHRTEWKAPPGQDAIMEALRQGNAKAGSYMFPHADRADKAAFEAAMKRWAEGPSGVLYIFPRGPMNMGARLVQQLIYFLVISFFLAYVGHHAGLDGQTYLKVFQVIGAVGFMTYGLGIIPESIWFARPWRNFFMGACDGLIYALLSAGAFGWLWPR